MRRTSMAAVAAVLLLCVTACGDDSDGLDLSEPTTQATSTATTAVTPSTTPTPSDSTPVNPEEQQILAQYRAFYAAVDAANADPAKVRDLLAPVATDAQLEQAASAVLGTSVAGETVYGEVVLNPRVASIDSDVAFVHDCQDTSKTGRSGPDGNALTVGLPEDSIKTTMTRGADGIWRASATEAVQPENLYCL